MNFDLQPFLENDNLVLRPTTKNDFEGLFEVASDPLLWEQHPAKERATREGFRTFFDQGIHSGGMLSIIAKEQNRIIGSSRFKFLSEELSAVEIGWTFLARKYWGGQINRQMKQLMIEHAHQFVKNVLLFIDKSNIRSFKAAEKIGALRLNETHPLHCLQKTDYHCTYLIAKHE
ncbi:MAG: GNAT family N-acetyltransferase [Bacteroidota bacterium]